MASIRDPLQVFGNHLPHPLGAFREDLKGMPISSPHGSKDLFDELDRDTLLEQIAHGVDKDPAWAFPGKGFANLLRHQSQIKSLLVGVIWDPAPSFGKNLGIAVLAASAYFGAPSYRVPSGVGPFDGTVVAQ